MIYGTDFIFRNCWGPRGLSVFVIVPYEKDNGNQIPVIGGKIFVTLNIDGQPRLPVNQKVNSQMFNIGNIPANTAD